MIVWKKTLNGNFGHVAICVDKSATVNKFVSSDQNWDGKSNASNKASTRPQLITHNYNHVAGFLRPKDQSKITKQEQKEDNMNELLQYLDVKDLDEAKAKLKEHLGEKNNKCGWGSDKDMGYLGSDRHNNALLQEEITKIKKEHSEKITTLEKELKKLDDELKKSDEVIKKKEEKHQAEVEILEKNIGLLTEEIKELKKQAGEKVCSLRESLLQFIDDIVERVKGAK